MTNDPLQRDWGRYEGTPYTRLAANWGEIMGLRLQMKKNGETRIRGESNLTS